ncbi:IS4 ORF [Shigella flexneri]|uniref:IS4 ORF n=1 Tax=Shigella flexneri TaxID=623 RepID=A0A658YZC8_SHIFL|nr:IS4 ORF [Shigella flexneri]
MHIGQALDLVSRYDSLRNPLTSLGDYLDPELISRCLAESGTVTLRKRRLPLEMMVWCIVGMALERKEPLHQIVNRLDIMLPGNRPFVAPSAVIQARQRERYHQWLLPFISRISICNNAGVSLPLSLRVPAGRTSSQHRLSDGVFICSGSCAGAGILLSGTCRTY